MAFRGASLDSVLESKLASKIVVYIAKTPHAYPTAISKELGIHVGVLNDYIRSLENHGIIIKGERTKAQEYHLDPDGISKLWKDIWLAKFEKNRNEQPDKKTDWDIHKIRGLLDSIAQHPDIFPLIISQVPHYSESSLSSILFDEFKGTLEVFFEGKDIFEFPQLRNKKKWKHEELGRLVSDLRDLYEITKRLRLSTTQLLAANWLALNIESWENEP